MSLYQIDLSNQASILYLILQVHDNDDLEIYVLSAFSPVVTIPNM